MDNDQIDETTQATSTDLAERPDDDAASRTEFITEPAKLMRIAAMAKAMMAEAKDAPSDEAGRERLRDIYQVTLDELCSVLSDDLRDELSNMFVPLESDETPSAAELRMAQAQLVGWLEGLFNGIQAAVMSQQLAAQSQLQHMTNPGLEQPPKRQAPGQYL